MYIKYEVLGENKMSNWNNSYDQSLISLFLPQLKVTNNIISSTIKKVGKLF